ncbi:MAG TPA: ribosome-associated translation inhibitor RaiA [Marinilabiliales bacterium]|nr:MAG: ribosomal subunit interface protein [Bacteroidetes bacterium GWD2_40_43]OFX92638.1 MAG: ribosomal subunit interface protein [Bacteroidetes bacterium GWE2_40_63]OFY17495.1 MAG: ribosomal subunit interface protein [Bacteroidetes bacterium GWF2_40_13]OFZ27571.1 MAG: ribosomal subunit interface protein [Bacteroidetes bacterium RIFOXYC2_FULL_40_12]HAM97224.1 ribosome-associated translation inhibitor RaiA [Marinilabiliales bacterium]
MNIKIQSVHFDADGKLLEFIENKLSKLDHIYDQIVGAEVVLKIEKSEDSQNKVTDIKILIPGNDLFSKRQAKTFEEATDLAVEALLKQLKRIKEKQRN